MMTTADSKIGILGTGIYIPGQVITAGEIAEVSGIPEHIVRTKLGITQKPIPGEEDHSSAMGIRAAQAALAKTGVDPAEIDLVIYIGEEYKEYPVWTAALKLQHEIGAFNAWGFDAALRCSTTVMALKVAQSMLLGDPAIQTVLLAGGYRNGDLIDYRNPRTRFMFNLSAGGGAILLRKGLEQNLLMESALITDGSFSDDYGHMGQIDQILSLELAIQSGQIKPGSVVILVSAGIGYAWGATTLRWG